MTENQWKKALEEMFKELPECGSSVDFAKVDALFTKHFPDSKVVRFDENGKEIM